MEAKADAAQRLGHDIDRRRHEIENEWLERVQRDVVKTPNVEITQLRDAMPDYLKALVGLLRGGGAAAGVGAGAAWSDVAREHGVTRVRIGFNISQLVHEFVVLRHVISDVLQQSGDDVGPQSILADVLDAAISVAVQAYADARDYQARREQAQNVAFITHELRNPLTTATMAAAQLRRRASPEQEGPLARLERGHRRLAELIDSVLLTEKLEAGDVIARPATVALEQVLEPALEAARKTAAEKGVAFQVDYDRRATVSVDPALTRSALQNLVDNAAKYTDAGDIQVSVDVTADAITFHVRDTCPGLSEEEMRTIFEPFKRGNTQKAGTGLGLAIARRATEAQGGSIHVKSSQSSRPTGCHFWVNLPARR